MKKLSPVVAFVWMGFFTFAAAIADFAERFWAFPGQMFVDDGFRLGVLLVGIYFFWSNRDAFKDVSGRREATKKRIPETFPE